MINLLPPEAKQAVKYQYLDRLIVVGGGLLMLVVVVNLLLIGGLWTILDIKDKSFSELDKQNKSSQTEKQFDELAITADQLNKNVLVVNDLSNYAYFSQILDVILDNKISGIKINSFNLKQSADSNVVEVVVSGVFDRRENFNVFINKLESRGDCTVICIDGVESSASNLIKETTGPFTVTVNITKPKK